MSLVTVNPLQSVEMKGRRQVKEGFLSLETIETWIVYVCFSEGEWARQTFSVPLNGVCSRCQAPRFDCVKICNAAWFFTGSHVYQEWFTAKRTSSQHDTTMGSVGVNMGQHPCGMLLTHCRVHTPTNVNCSEGKSGCNSI